MGEYLNFINKYSSKYNFDLQFNDYVNIKSYVSNVIDETLSFRGIKIDNNEALIYFVMCYLLYNHTAREILDNGYENEIEVAIEKAYTRQQATKPKEEQVPFPAKNAAVDYIYKDLKEISYIFKEGLNLGLLSKNIKDSLLFEGHKEDDILEGNCDEIIIEYLAKGYFDVRFSEDFKNMRSVITDQVVSIFNYKKKDTRYYTNKDNFEYMYYNSPTNMSNVIFKITLAFLDNKVNPRKLNSSAPEMEVVHNYIEKDMIRVNSTRPKYKPETAYEKWNKLSREKQEEKIEYAKKAAIVLAIIFGLVAVENMIYNSIHNDKKESKRYKNKYQVETNAYDLDRVSANFQNLRYNSNENEVIVPEADIKYDINNAAIDDSIEILSLGQKDEDALPNPEELINEMEGENVVKL